MNTNPNSNNNTNTTNDKSKRPRSVSAISLPRKIRNALGKNNLSSSHNNTPKLKKVLWGIGILEGSSFDIAWKFVSYCIDWLKNKKGENIEGIFRISADELRLEALQMELERKLQLTDDLTFNIELKEDTHTVSTLLKRFFRAMTVPLLTFEMYPAFIAADKCELDQKRNSLKKVVELLPDNNRTILEGLCAYLKDIAANSSVNLMSSKNLAIVIAPNILWPNQRTALTELGDAHHVSGIIQCLIDYYDDIFNTEPLEIPDIEEFQGTLREHYLEHRKASKRVLLTYKELQGIDDESFKEQVEVFTEKIRKGDEESINIMTNHNYNPITKGKDFVKRPSKRVSRNIVFLFQDNSDNSSNQNTNSKSGASSSTYSTSTIGSSHSSNNSLTSSYSISKSMKIKLEDVRLDDEDILNLAAAKNPKRRISKRLSEKKLAALPHLATVFQRPGTAPNEGGNIVSTDVEVKRRQLARTRSISQPQLVPPEIPAFKKKVDFTEKHNPPPAPAPPPVVRPKLKKSSSKENDNHHTRKKNSKKLRPAMEKGLSLDESAMKIKRESKPNRKRLSLKLNHVSNGEFKIANDYRITSNESSKHDYQNHVQPLQKTLTPQNHIQSYQKMPTSQNHPIPLKSKNNRPPDDDPEMSPSKSHPESCLNTQDSNNAISSHSTDSDIFPIEIPELSDTRKDLHYPKYSTETKIFKHRRSQLHILAGDVNLSRLKKREVEN